eukprot:2950301-Pleurochrysis_carterae.AAC.7
MNTSIRHAHLNHARTFESGTRISTRHAHTRQCTHSHARTDAQECMRVYTDAHIRARARTRGGGMLTTAHTDAHGFGACPQPHA